MKKYFWLMLLGLLIVAFSATSYAADLKVSGYIRADSYLLRNVAETATDGGIYGPIASDFRPGGGAFNRKAAWMKARARLKFDLMTDKNLKGTIQFEMDADRWGNIDGTRNSYGFWGADRAAVEVKNAYADIGLPYFGIPVPMTVRIGLQGFSVRKGMVLDNDGMGIMAGINADPVTITPFWAKTFEGQDATADDNDLYGMTLTAKLDQISIGGYGIYFNMNTYPNSKASTGSYGSRITNYTADMFWIGAFSEGKLGPIGYNADVVFDTGSVDFVGDTAGVKDVDYDGWATRIKVKYPWEKFEFGGTFLYASGADQKKTSGTGLPNSATPWGTTTTKVKSYVAVPGDGGSLEEGFILYDNWDLGVENYATSYSNTIGGIKSSGTLSRGGLGGTWMARLYVSTKLAPWYKIHLQGMYVGDTTKNGNTYGNARKASGRPRDDKEIGWELGLLNTFQIYKDLVWFVGGGYVIPGDGMDLWNGTKNVSPKDPWQIATRLVYSF